MVLNVLKGESMKGEYENPYSCNQSYFKLYVYCNKKIFPKSISAISLAQANTKWLSVVSN